MTNATMFVYVCGVAMKQGTTNAWDKVYELSRENEHIKKWFESPYVQTVNQDTALMEVINNAGL